jgi:hypothetical protein
MPPANPSPRRHLNEVPRPRHKAKPKFDIPVEAGGSEAPVGWVYRAEDAPSTVAAVQESPPRQVPGIEAPRPQHRVHEPPPEEQGSAVFETIASFGTSFLLVGAGFCLIGLGTVDFTARAAIGMITLPMRLVKGILTSR